MLQLAVAVFLSASMLAPPGERPAIARDVHAERAGALFEDGQFLEAAQEFALAFESTHEPVFLFAQAQALRRAGSCGGAIEVLRQYLESAPDKADQAEAERIIAACEDILNTSSTRDPAPPPAPEPRASAADAAPPHVRSILTDRWGASLTGAGVGSVAVGAILLGTGYRMSRPGLLPEADYEVRQRRVRGLSTSGTVLLSVGGALLLAGVVRYAIVARRRRPATRRDVRAAAPGRGSVRW